MNKHCGSIAGVIEGNDEEVSGATPRGREMHVDGFHITMETPTLEDSRRPVAASQANGRGKMMCLDTKQRGKQLDIAFQ